MLIMAQGHAYWGQVLQNHILLDKPLKTIKFTT
jgi:hypothetical protein